MVTLLWIALVALAVPVFGLVAWLVCLVWIVNRKDEGGSQ